MRRKRRKAAARRELRHLLAMNRLILFHPNGTKWETVSGSLTLREFHRKHPDLHIVFKEPA